MFAENPSSLYESVFRKLPSVDLEIQKSKSRFILSKAALQMLWDKIK